MFDRFKIKRRRKKIIREDMRNLEARARRFLADYLSASDAQKNRYHDVVAGASAGCHHEHAVSCLDNLQLSEVTAEAANAVALHRIGVGNDCLSGVTPLIEEFITDAYATAAVAYRCAAGIYVDDERMQKLGTDAVRLLTVATSHRMDKSNDGYPSSWQRFAQSATQHGLQQLRRLDQCRRQPTMDILQAHRKVAPTRADQLLLPPPTQDAPIAGRRSPPSAMDDLRVRRAPNRASAVGRSFIGLFRRNHRV